MVRGRNRQKCEPQIARTVALGHSATEASLRVVLVGSFSEFMLSAAETLLSGACPSLRVFCESKRGKQSIKKNRRIKQSISSVITINDTTSC